MAWMHAPRESCDGKAPAPLAGWAPFKGWQRRHRAALAARALRHCSAGSLATTPRKTLAALALSRGPRKDDPRLDDAGIHHEWGARP
jgi:hypothetical protein